MNRNRALLATTIAVAFCALATSAGARQGVAVLTPSTDVKFSDVPGFPGVQMAVVQGDPAKGPHHSMLKFAPGFEAPVHHHTTDHYGSVLSGTLVLVSDGREVRLPPGSYFAFTGKMPHATRCEKGSDCVVAIDARGKWDVVPETKKGAAKK
jgi:quercetin dioxygenase-like cupin family protein